MADCVIRDANTAEHFPDNSQYLKEVHSCSRRLAKIDGIDPMGLPSIYGIPPQLSQSDALVFLCSARSGCYCPGGRTL